MSLAKLLKRAHELGLLDDGEDERWAQRSAEVRAIIESGLCGPQLQLIEDQSSRLLACCGRQVGKNYTLVRLLIVTALEGPDRYCVYINQTFAEARRIMWSDVVDGIPAVLRELEVDFEANESRMEIVLSNGSRIECLGADRAGYGRLRGTKLDLAVLDECQKAEGLSEAITRILTYATAARHGRIVMVGTPNEYCVGYFHDASEGIVPGWAVHKWTAEHNDRRPDIWEQMLANKLASRQQDDDPDWLREGKGLWVRSTRVEMLPVDRFGSIWDGLLPQTIPSKGGVPVPRSEQPLVCAGVDTGTSPDPWAMVIGARSREEGVLREVHSEHHNELNTEQQSERMRWAMETHGVTRFYVDAGAQGRQIAKDYRELYRLPVVDAEKHDKATWQDELYADSRSGKVLVLRDSELHRECSQLVYDQKQWAKGNRETAPGLKDDLYHAWLYLFRGLRVGEPRAPDAPLTADERQEAERQKIRREVLNRNKGRRR